MLYGLVLLHYHPSWLYAPKRNCYYRRLIAISDEATWMIDMARRVNSTVADTLEALGRGLVLGFMILLVIAAAMLAIGDKERANRFAEYAYYSLVGGVLLLLVFTVLQDRIESGDSSREPGVPAAGTAASRRGLGITSSGIIWAIRSAVDKYSLLITGLGFVGALLLTGVELGVTVLPGRPTLLAPEHIRGNLLDITVALSLIGYIGLIIIGELALGLAGVVLTAVLVNIDNYMLSLVPPLVYVAYFITYNRLLASVTILSFTAGVAVLTSLFHDTLGFAAWGIVGAASFAGLILGFAAYAGILLARQRPIAYESSTLAKDDSGARDIAGAYSGTRLPYVVGLLAGLAVAAATIIIPHMRYDWRVVSLDTLFNVKFCSRLAAGDTSVFITWMRPLYVASTCVPALLLGLDLQLFFDVVLPIIGLSLLALSVYRLARSTGLSGWWATAAIPLSMAYWSPFFAYAGFQTNLLILPLALLFARWSTSAILEYRVDRKALLASAVLGAWHPWTLAYFSGALLASFLLAGDLAKRARSLVVLAPGWLVHLAVSLAASGSGVASVAVAMATKYKPIVWSLEVFIWGTGLRGDILLPLGILLVAAVLRSIRLDKEHPWLVGSSMLAFVGIIFPMGQHFLRLLIDAPLPLLLLVLLKAFCSSDAEDKRYCMMSLLAILFLSIAAWIYLLSRLTPTPYLSNSMEGML